MGYGLGPAPAKDAPEKNSPKDKSKKVKKSQSGTGFGGSFNPWWGSWEAPCKKNKK